MTTTRTARIAELNDGCRLGLDPSARIVATSAALARITKDDGDAPLSAAKVRLLHQVATYAFRPEDGPERDRGSFELDGA